MLKVQSGPILFITIFMLASFAMGFIGVLSGSLPKEVEEYFQEVGLPYFPWYVILGQITAWLIIFCLPGYFLVSAFWPKLAWPEKSILILLWGLVIASFSPALFIPALGTKTFVIYQYALDSLFSLGALIVGFIIWSIKKITYL